MGLETTRRVWEHSQHSGNDLLVLLAIADYADENSCAYPSIPTLAEKARVTERTVYNVIARLEASGELIVARRRGRGLNNHYLVAVGLDRKERQTAQENLKAALENLKRKPESGGGKGEAGDRVSGQKPESDDRVSGQKPESDDAKNLKVATGKPESGDTKNLKPASPDPSLEQSGEPSQDQESPAPPKRPKTPAAVAAFRRAAHRFPAKSWYADIDEAVGEDPAQLERWQALVKEWVGKGWNPTNVSGMLDAWRSGGIEGKSNGRGKSSLDTPPEPPGFGDQVRAAIRKAEGKKYERDG